MILQRALSQICQITKESLILQKNQTKIGKTLLNIYFCNFFFKKKRKCHNQFKENW